jgi:hypothetical protein
MPIAKAAPATTNGFGPRLDDFCGLCCGPDGACGDATVSDSAFLDGMSLSLPGADRCKPDS